MSSSRGRILCVDDEEIPRTLRTLVLRKAGYEVLMASSGAEAIEFLANHTFDLLLTDQMMPGMAGTELTRIVKTSLPSMAVVIISGMNEMPAGAELADRFISKVGGPAALFQVVEEMLSHSRTATSNPTDTALGEDTGPPAPVKGEFGKPALQAD